MRHRCLDIATRRKRDSSAGRVDVGASERTVNAGGAELEPASAVKGIEPLLFIVIRIVVAAGVIVFQCQMRGPGRIETVADIGVLVPGAVLLVQAVAGAAGRSDRAELADRLQLKVETGLGRLAE